MNLKFNLKQLHDFDNDLKASKKAIPLVVVRVLNAKLRTLRNSLRQEIPRETGRLQRSFGYVIKRKQGVVLATFGFLRGKRVSKETAIAANVLQNDGASPKKGAYLWIPTVFNRNADGTAIVSPHALIQEGKSFVGGSGTNRVAYRSFDGAAMPMFVLARSVRLSKPPLQIDQAVEGALPEILAEIPDTIGQILAAKNAVELSLNG